MCSRRLTSNGSRRIDKLSFFESWWLGLFGLENVLLQGLQKSFITRIANYFFLTNLSQLWLVKKDIFILCDLFSTMSVPIFIFSSFLWNQLNCPILFQTNRNGGSTTLKTLYIISVSPLAKRKNRRLKKNAQKKDNKKKKSKVRGFCILGTLFYWLIHFLRFIKPLQVI